MSLRRVTLDLCSVLSCCEVQATPSQLIEIDNSKSGLDDATNDCVTFGRCYFSVDRCPGTTIPVACQILSAVTRADTGNARDSRGFADSVHSRPAHRSVAMHRRRCLGRVLPKVSANSFVIYSTHYNRRA